MKKILFSALILLSLFVLVSCEEHKDPCGYKFSEGDIVKIKIDGRKAQILQQAGCFGGRIRYVVRYNNPAIFTDTQIINRDGPLYTKSYTHDYFYEFELEK
jgi:hypothetical protein